MAKGERTSAAIGDAVYNILLLSPQPRWTMLIISSFVAAEEKEEEDGCEDTSIQESM
jgi:hypothetical protein